MTKSYFEGDTTDILKLYGKINYPWNYDMQLPKELQEKYGHVGATAT